VEFRVLGTLEVLAQDGPVPLAGARQRALLALLLLHANDVVSTDTLIDALWDGEPPPTAAKVLQNAVSQLRKSLGRDRLETHGSSYRLAVEEDELDAAVFERAVQRGRQELAAGDASAAAVTLAAADALWRGPALADFVYDDFAAADATRLEELRLVAREARIDADLALGRADELVPELRLLADRYPLREGLRAQLMLALYRSGRQAEALQVFRETREALVEELGVEPGAALQALEKAILRQDPELDVEPVAVPAPQPAAPAASEDVRRTVAVVVCQLAADPGLDPERMRRVLDEAASRVSEVFAAAGAHCERPAADEIVAALGLQRVHEHDALRAARAALAARDAARSDVLTVRIGVDLGETVGGDEEQLSFAAPAALAAARTLARAAPADEAVAGARAEQVLRGSVAVEQLDGGGFLLHEASPESAVPPRALDSPLVGRADELAELERALAHTERDSTCRLVTVLGPAGIGKSRLAAELRAQAGERARVLAGRGRPFGDGRPFQPLFELLGDALGEDVRAGILRVLAGDEDAVGVADRIAALSEPAEDAASASETSWALRKLLERLAQDGPLVVLLDDAHWVEPALLGLVGSVADLSRSSPILLVCFARPELLDDQPGWGGGKANAATLLLEPLDDLESAALIGSRLGADLPERLRAQILAAAEGNPLFIEQMLSTLIDDGVLRREGDGWAWAGGTVQTLPPTIQALLAARLDRLEMLERRLLQVGSVVGSEVDAAELAALVGESPERVRATLETLVRKELVRPLPGGAGSRFRFRHGLIREAAYATLPKRGRAVLHRRLAEELLAAGGAERAEPLGHHFEQAYRYEQELGASEDVLLELAAAAADWLGRAGRDAQARDDAHAATALLERAAALCPPGPARAALVTDLGDAQAQTGAFPVAAATIARALAEAEALGDERLVWSARVAQLRVWPRLTPQPSNDELEAEAARSIAALERIGEQRGLGRAWAARSWIPWFDGQAGEAAEAARRSVEYAVAAGDALTADRSTRTLLGCVVFGPTPVAEGIALCERVLEETGTSRPLTRATALRARAALEALAGHVDEARALVARDRALVREIGVELYEQNVAQVAVMVELAAGDGEVAEREARAAYELVGRIGDSTSQAEFAARLAAALVLLDRGDEARDLCELAAETAAPDDRAVQVHWRLPLARVLAERGAGERALELAREAVAIAAATDFLVLHGDALVAEARVLERIGESGADALQQAQALYDRKGAVGLAALLAG
jgi:DNA-binding SARP family transcriptional activator